MGMYYNRGRGNLPLTLTEGRSISVPGNSWVELTGADETVASVQRAVRKGQLHRKPVRAKKAAPAPEPEAPAPKAEKPKKKISPAAPKAAAKEEAKTSAPAEEEAAAPTATADPKPSTAGKSSRRGRRSK
jgi:hypothetical protein